MSDKVRVVVYMPELLARKLKLYAFDNRMTLSAFIVKLIREAISKAGPDDYE
jgi:hypothetical protein